MTGFATPLPSVRALRGGVSAFPAPSPILGLPGRPCLRVRPRSRDVKKTAVLSPGPILSERNRKGLRPAQTWVSVLSSKVSQNIFIFTISLNPLV